MRKLTLKQKFFADSYLELGNAYQAARKAGYSEAYSKGSVVKLLENVSVRAYIDKRLEKLESEKIASAAEVMQYLTSVLRGDEKEETVVVESIGDGMSEARLVNKTVTPKDKLKAAELLAKRYGILTDRLNVEGSVTVVVTGDDELED